MRIAISGKGGTGKTTIAGALCRLWAEGGHDVLALDADSNPNLAISLGLPRDGAAQLNGVPSSLGEWRTDANGDAYVHLTLPFSEVRRRYAVPAGEGVELMVMGTVDHAGVGCRCSAHASARGIMGHLFRADAPIVLADMEAGLEHLGRGTVEHADALLVVVEPYFRALEAGQRIRKLAQELGVPRVFVVANKVRSQTEEEAVRAFCARHRLPLLAVLPFDEAALAAEMAETTLLETAPDGPLGSALAALADQLLNQVGAPEKA